MANQYTSIATTPGFGDNTVIDAYSFLIDSYFREQATARQFVDKRPEQVNGPGHTITLQFRNFFDDAAITAAKTPLDEESDVDSRKLPKTDTVDLTVHEYGDVVTTTKALNLFSFGNIDQEVVIALGDHMTSVIDELIQDVMEEGTQALFAGSGSTQTDHVEDTDELTSALLRQGKTWLRNNNVPTWTNGFYAAMIHPNVVHDVREETGSGGWRVPNEYGMSQDRIWRGEFGEYEGLRYVENTRTRKAADGTGGDTVYRTFILGRQAIAESVREEPHFVVGPALDKLNRFRHVGWTGVLGWCLYRDKSIVRIESGSSMTGVI